MRDPRLRGFEGLLKGPVKRLAAPPQPAPEPEPEPEPAATPAGTAAAADVQPTVQCQVVVPEGAGPGTQLLVNVPVSTLDPNWLRNQRPPPAAAPATWPLLLALSLPVLLAAAWQSGLTAP